MLSILLVTGPYGIQDPRHLRVWKTHCLINVIHSWFLTSYLLLDLTAKNALVDVIVFFPDEYDTDYGIRSLVLTEDVRDLPENCCMRDGRKWNKIPCVVLATARYLDGLPYLREASIPIVRYGPFQDFRWTLKQLMRVVQQYQERVLDAYRKVGLLVSYANGRYRVKWALQRKSAASENDYYHSPSDRRRLAKYVTVHREIVGIAYEAQLFEALINDPQTRETELQRFLEEHPAFLMDAMRGIPISHEPKFLDPDRWTPDFVLPPAVATNRLRSVQIAELKGVHEPILVGKLHRGYSQAVMAAVNQIRDYERILRERRPLNASAVIAAFGFQPERTQLAVVIGRAPRRNSGDEEVMRQRLSEQPDVRIVPYDELLQAQREQSTFSDSGSLTVPGPSHLPVD